jgi:polysaccharide pyruvyl transferase WcaK-like protein
MVPGFYDKDAEALLEGSFRHIRTIDNASISLISRSIDFDKYRYDVRVIGINYKDLKRADRIIHKLKYPQYLLLALFYSATGKYLCYDRLVVENALWKELCGSDVIIAGLGDSFTTRYGTTPFFVSFYDILLGKLLDKKVVLYGGSIGPFEGKWFEFLGRYILNKPDLITLGEEISREYLQSIGVRNPHIHVTADLAFPMETAPEDRVAEILKAEGIGPERMPLVGVSMNRTALNQVDPESNIKFIKVIAEALDDVIEKTGATVVFLPHSFGPCDYYDDRITLGYFKNEMRMKNNALILKNTYTPGELRGLVGKCDLFIGSRTRAVISSAMAGVPFVALDTGSFEMRGIIGRMLRCEDYIVDTKDLDCDTLSKKIMDIWTQKKPIAGELRQKMSGMKERALANVSLLREIGCPEESSKTR